MGAVSLAVRAIGRDRIRDVGLHLYLEAFECLAHRSNRTSQTFNGFLVSVVGLLSLTVVGRHTTGFRSTLVAARRTDLA